MRIENLTSSIAGDLARISATFKWEDCERPEREIYIETPLEFRDDLNCNPNTFITAGIMPAMRHGEKRILVDGSVCPQLRNGLETACLQFRKWYGSGVFDPVSIEATGGFKAASPSTPARVASFFSGGVDSMTTLRSNRLDFPLDHPASISDCVLLYGFDLGGYENLPGNRENFEYAVSSCSRLAALENFTLIPVYSNVRYLDDDDSNMYQFYFGAILAAIAHGFTKRITTALIPSCACVLGGMSPMGSHPLLDRNYGSAVLTIEHDGARFSRFEKTGLIADWDNGLKHLSTCWNAFRSRDVLNCGECEKCIRTMATLLVYGKLGQCPTYPLDDISPGLLRTIKVGLPATSPSSRKELIKAAYLTLGAANIGYWRDLVAPLERIGREDLVVVIRDMLARYEKQKARIEELDWLGAIKRLDRRLLGGGLRNSYRLLTGKRIR